MTTFAYHMAEAIEAACDTLDSLVDSITYSKPHLVLKNETELVGHSVSVTANRMRSSRPFAVCDSANGGVTVARFESREWAERFARGHQRTHGSTLDYDSFRTEDA